MPSIAEWIVGSASWARASGIAELEIVVDSHEQYTYHFTGQQVRTLTCALPCGDYGVTVDGRLVASVERKSLTEFVLPLTRYNLPVLKSALLLRIGESLRQFSGWTLSQRLPLPSSFPTWSSRLNHCSALLILLG
jgi:hypothetical protein